MTKNILIVDDTPDNLRILAGMVIDLGFKPRPVLDGELALQAAQHEPPDLVLLDIMMPNLDGYLVGKKIRDIPGLQDVPIIFISALTETEDKIKAFAAGGVDYISKPFQFDEVKARITTHMRLRDVQMQLTQKNKQMQEVIREQIKDIYESQMATIFALAKLAESRDDNTGKHLDRVRTLAMLISTRLGEPAYAHPQVDATFIENIYYASPLHDIGKVAIPDSILLKPGALTKEEFDVMKTHAQFGAKTLEAVQNKYTKNKFLQMGIEIALNHHEKWDGSGYPGGLKGENIPLSARIVALADVYDALRTERCYRPALKHAACCEIIHAGKGTHFDPVLVEIFVELESTLENYQDLVQLK